MNVKLQIKEVKEEWRPITLEEKCMFLLSTDMHYSQKIRDEIEKRMDMLGLIRRGGSENVVFRVETIRDATPKEIIAWHCLESYKECVKVDGKCYACPLNVTDGICIPRNCEWIIVRELLRGKEVIVSLTEESI